MRIHPRIRRVGARFALEKARDAARFEQRHLLGVAQVRVRLIFDEARRAVDVARKQAMQRIGLAARVDFFDDRRSGVIGAACGEQRLDFLGGVSAVRLDAGEPQRPLHRDFPIAEGRVGEDF